MKRAARLDTTQCKTAGYNDSPAVSVASCTEKLVGVEQAVLMVEPVDHRETYWALDCM